MMTPWKVRMNDAVSITHAPDRQQFEALAGGHPAVCCYRRMGVVLVLHHTEVAPELEGRGIAAALVKAALAWARSEGLRVRPTCSYVAAYMRRHPETQDLLQA
jgi:predicted GNAT family acetyltransferase